MNQVSSWVFALAATSTGTTRFKVAIKTAILFY